MTATPSYKVNVQTKSLNQEYTYSAYLQPAQKSDMPSNWECDWQSFWDDADFDCEAIIKLTLNGNILGLIRFALYPYWGDNRPPEFLLVSHLECISEDKRNVNPVGYWLLWYAFQISFEYCTGENDGTTIKLDSVESAIDYYEKKVRMTGLGWTNYPGTDEELYAFSFKEQPAREFCCRVEQRYGKPILC